MTKRWQKVEVQYLTKNATSKSVEELAERFHTDVAAVKMKLSELGLGDTPNRSMADAEAAALASFEAGVASLQAGAWAQAHASLTAAATIGNDAPELATAARRYLAVAERRLEDAGVTDPFAAAVFAKNRGEFDAALSTARPHADKDERFAYLTAAIHARLGDHEQAVAQLERAIALLPRNRRHAANDPDFEALRGDAAFAALVRG